MALLVGLPSSGAAQEVGQVAGTVTDSSSGQGIGGAQILVTGTTFGTVSGDDGRYSIARVPAGTHTIQVRRVGYSPREVRVTVAAGEAASLNVALRSAPLQLEAVVTTGVVDPTSGTRVPFTVGRLDVADAPVPAANALETLQGKMSGVSIMASGQPGSGTNIQLRSPTSINKSNSPLIVVDGVILTQAFGTSSADLESLDIESVDVVKGAAAASLYGSRASAGVIQIRTRRGSQLADGTTKWTVRAEMGMNELGGKIPWAQNHHYRTDANGWYTDVNGQPITPGNADSARLKRVEKPVTTRFQDTPYRDRIYDQVESFFDPGQTYKMSMNGGQNTTNTNWFGSVATSREDGVILKNGGTEQNTVRLNLDHRPTENLSLGISAFHSRADRQEIGAPFFPLINQSPDVNLLQPDPDGSPYAFQPDVHGREANPLYTLYNTKNNTDRARTQGSIEARYKPLNWLNFDANASYDRSDRRTNYFLNAGVKTGTFPTGSPGEIEEFAGTTDAVNASVGANLIGRFGDFTVRSTVRGLVERENNQTTTANGTVLSVPGVESLNTAQVRNLESARTEIRSSGYFGTLGMDFAGKYIVDGLVRRDGSSLFGPEERWNTYNRVSGSYRVSQEQWWPLESVNEFKLRVSRGTAGGRPSFNDQFETYDFTAGGGVQKVTLGNRFLKPELATEVEYGIDAIIKERFSVQLSYARTVVEDQLIQIPLSSMFGYTSQWQNAGTIKGNTIEGTIEAQLVTTPKFSWRMGLVADRSRNKITEFNTPCFRVTTVAYRCAGETLGTMYGFSLLKSADQLPAAAAARASEFQVNDDGLLVWVGQGNNYTDGEAKSLWGTSATIGTGNYLWGQAIRAVDSVGNFAVTRIGDGNPKAHFGVSNNVTWNDIRIYALVDAQIGGQVYNQTRQRMYQYGRHKDVDQAGKAQELKKTFDYYVGLYSANDPVEFFVEDAGFVKLREVSLSYRVPGKYLGAVNRTGVTGAQFSLIGRNLLTFTDYSGYDPEVSSSANSLVRLDSYSYPRYRTVTAAVELTF
jgi:TonB-linked SusC/RagA family outer membrane protein